MNNIFFIVSLIEQFIQPTIYLICQLQKIAFNKGTKFYPKPKSKSYTLIIRPQLNQEKVLIHKTAKP